MKRKWCKKHSKYENECGCNDEPLPLTGLLSCPFCGGIPRFDNDENPSGALMNVECCNCGAIGPIRRSRDEAVRLWNQRAR